MRSGINEILRGMGAYAVEVASDDEGGNWFIGRLRIQWSIGGGWDHVSVSAGWTDRGATREPTWDELEFIRRVFFEPTETVIQIHPPIDRYVSRCRYVLHLWRPQSVEIPLPPMEFV